MTNFCLIVVFYYNNKNVYKYNFVKGTTLVNCDIIVIVTLNKKIFVFVIFKCKCNF